jgi:hypothetical protein
MMGVASAIAIMPTWKHSKIVPLTLWGFPNSQPRPKTTVVLVLSRTQFGQEEPAIVQG